MWGSNRSPAQKWKILYADEAQKFKTKGKNVDHGFDINRPFHLVSTMGWKRLVTVGQGNYLKLRKYKKGETKQQWQFDQASKTIKSVGFGDRNGKFSISILSNGRSARVRAEATNSRWF